MGFLSDIGDKIGDVLGDVVDGVVDFVDDVIGVDLKKVLDNKWVKYGLMAASLFTGGVAIVNGVVQGAGAAANATGFMAKFVEGAAGFVKGAASGIINPMKTAQGLPGEAGKLLSGNAGSMTGAATDAARSAAQAAGENVIANTPTDLLAGDATGAFDPSATNFQMGQPTDVLSEGFNAADAVNQSAAPNLSSSATEFSDAVASGATSAPGAAPVPGMDLASGVVPEPPTDEPGFFTRMAQQAKDFAASPAGMKTIAGAAQGWAAGQARQEELDEIRNERRRRRQSWSGFGDKTNSILSGQPISLQQLRERRQQTMNRGNQAQAEYGY